MKRPRYIVGIDLGTTNSAAAYAEISDSQRGIQPFPIPQLVAEAKIAERSVLPSFLYVAGEHDVAPGALALPWDPQRSYAVGEFARAQGARVPGRLVSSAKSWLCHGGVDRESPILPWAAPDDVPKLSPVEVSARYLLHIREAWAQSFPQAPLEEQDVILTVPASFDEVARELTVEAAERAGLRGAVLLEEPQATFYAWVHANESVWQERLAEVSRALVIDVGGGTSDFSLIAVGREDGRLALERQAVGDHLLLGGDNIDVALARQLEPQLGVKLDSQRWHALTSLCRNAKEALLGTEAPDEVILRLPGRGTGVVGGVLTAALRRQEVEALVLDGFFPLVPADSVPRRQARLGLQEWGLPFAAEPEVSRHIAAFIRQHLGPQANDTGANAWPEAVLFNGGALKPELIRRRLAELLGSWNSGREPMVLPSVDLDLAVARGAAYYGLVRRGRGIRIGGGSGRSYYLGIAGADSGADQVAALCLVHRGMHEGEEVEITSPEFGVLANQPASFPLYTSSTRSGDRAGEVLRLPRDSVAELPPIRTVLRFGKKLAATTLPVHVLSKLTEIGTLEVWLRSLRTDHRWRLQFALRDQLPAAEAEESAAADEASLEVGEDRLGAAIEAIREVFPPEGSAGGGDPLALTRTLEERLDAGKDAWAIGAIRKLWDALWEGRNARGSSERLEARWLNLSGFLLRPGFGHELDDWRVQQLWKLHVEGPRHPRTVQCRVEWWNMWKRIAGGLSRPQQGELYSETAPWLVPRLKSRIKDKKAPVGPQELREYWQLLASCERLAADAKAELGKTLLPSVAKGKATEAEIWTLGRLGARAPISGPLNCVVPRKVAGEWIEALLQRPWRARPDMIGFAAVQLARYVGDRERDLDEGLRRRLAERLRSLPRGERAARLVTELVPLEQQERARIMDESLPAGLQLQ